MNNRSTKKCKYFFSSYGCLKGNNCRFSHEEQNEVSSGRMENRSHPYSHPSFSSPRTNEMGRGRNFTPPYPPPFSPSNYGPPPPGPYPPYPIHHPPPQPLYVQPQTFRINTRQRVSVKTEEDDSAIPFIIKRCDYFFSPEGCNSGLDCSFSHQKFNSPCQFFEMKGKCENGKYCRFLHQYRYREYGSVVESSKPKKEKEETEDEDTIRRSLFECPPDTICHISNFFSRPKDILPLIFSCRTFQTIFSNPNFSACENVWFLEPTVTLPKFEAKFVRRFLIRNNVGKTKYNSHLPSHPMGPHPIIPNVPHYNEQNATNRYQVRDYIKYFPNVTEIKIKFCGVKFSGSNFFFCSTIPHFKVLSSLNKISFCVDLKKSNYRSYSFSKASSSSSSSSPTENEENKKKKSLRLMNEMLSPQTLTCLVDIQNLRSLSFSFHRSGDKGVSSLHRIPYQRSLSKTNKEEKSSFLIDRVFVQTLQQLKNLKELNFNNSYLEVSSEWGDREIKSVERLQNPSSSSSHDTPNNNRHRHRHRNRGGGYYHEPVHFDDIFNVKGYKETLIEKRLISEWSSIQVLRVYGCKSITLSLEFLLSFPNANRFQICGCGRMYSRDDLKHIFERKECLVCSERETNESEKKMGPMHYPRPYMPNNNDDDNKKKKYDELYYHIQPRKEISSVDMERLNICRCFKKCRDCGDRFGACSMCVCGDSSTCRSCHGKDNSHGDDAYIEENYTHSHHHHMPNRRRNKPKKISYYTKQHEDVRECGKCRKFFCTKCIHFSFHCKSFPCKSSRLYCHKCRRKSAVKCSLCNEKKCVSTKLTYPNDNITSFIMQPPNSSPLGYPGYMPVGISPFNMLSSSSKAGCSKSCEDCESNGWCFECILRITSPRVRADSEISRWIEMGKDSRMCVFRCRCGSGYKVIFHDSNKDEQGRYGYPHYRHYPYGRRFSLPIIEKMTQYDIRKYF